MEGLKRAMACLEAEMDRPVGERTALLPVPVCQAVIAHVEGQDTRPMDPERARKAVVSLLANYPNGFSSRDGETEKLAYMASMAKVFAAFPEWAGVAAVNPVTGLPSRARFLPTPAELKAELEAVIAKRRACGVRAQAHMREAQRRAEAEQLERQIRSDRETVSAEQREKQIAEALKCLRSMDQLGDHHG